MSDKSQGDKPAESDKKTNGVNEDANKKNALHQSSSPIVPNVNPGQESTQIANHKKSNPKHWLKESLESLAIFAAIFLAGTSVYQIREMRADRILDERAWVAPYDFEPERADNGMYYFEVTYKNTGKTPAINCDAVFLGTNSYSNFPIKDIRPPAPEAAQLLAPNGGAIVTTGTIPQQEFQDIKNGTPFYLYGTIWYDDIFGHHHWTQFGLRFETVNGDISEFVSTPNHNSCDDAQTNRPNK